VSNQISELGLIQERLLELERSHATTRKTLEAEIERLRSENHSLRAGAG
jgi:hypothetical protein